MDPVVFLSPSASLKGKVSYLEGSKKPVYTYLGVPFAEPPVGPLRLQKPVTKKLWEGQREATECGPGPLQNSTMGESLLTPYGLKAPKSYDEDCLYLSVYTPSNNASDSLPVMVWIYGGAFIGGFVDPYMGTALSSLQDVVIVAITYRVGTLGFFSTGDETCPGNFGLWDQIEGLKWVKEHISKFGGDPNNVTLFGESAGGISTSIHHVIPASRSLFNKSIHLSGVATVSGHEITPQQNKDNCAIAAKVLGLPEASFPSEVLSALKAMPGEELSLKMMAVPLGPCIDGDLITLSSYEAYSKGEFYKSNSIFMLTTHEGIMVFDAYKLHAQLSLDSKSDFPNFLKYRINRKNIYTIKDTDGFINAIMEEYVPQENPTQEELEMAMVEILTDYQFYSQVDAFARMHSGAVAEGTYFGVYGYRCSRSPYRSQVKASHGEDVPIEFGLPFMTAEDRLNREWSDNDKKMSETVMAYLGNFAKYGNPNGPSPGSNPVWHCFTPDKPDYLYLDEPCSVGTHYKPSRQKFWSTVPQKF